MTIAVLERPTKTMLQLKRCEGPDCEVWFQPVTNYRMANLRSVHRYHSQRCQHRAAAQRERAQRAKQRFPKMICCKICAKRVPWRSAGHKYCSECRRKRDNQLVQKRLREKNPNTGVITCQGCQQVVPRRAGTQKWCDACRVIRRKTTKKTYEQRNAIRHTARKARAKSYRPESEPVAG